MDYFRSIQDKFVRQIDNSRKINKMPHALLIEGSNRLILDKAIDYVLFSLLCKNNPVCFECNECKRVINKTLSDLIVYDLNDANLKKDQVREIQERFMVTALDASNKQFYVIKDIDKASDMALSALLKFLEEPNENVYAIFTTSNRNSVLATIVSRCLHLKLKEDRNYDMIEALKEEYDESDVEIACKISNDEETIKAILNSEALALFKENGNKIFKSIFDNYFFVVMYELLNDLEKEELSFFFDIFYILIINSNLFVSYVDDIELFDMLRSNDNYSQLLDVVLSTRVYLNTNMAKSLIIDKFSLRIGGLFNESC